MSFSKKDRNFRERNGKDFPDNMTNLSFIEAIADALQAEFGSTPSRIKVLARLIGSNERTVKNWFYARNGPSGESLVELMRHSPVILKLVLHRAGQRDLIKAVEMATARQQLRTALDTLSGIFRADGKDTDIQD